MVTDEEIASCVASLLRLPDSASAGSDGVRRQVEHKLGVDLSHRSVFIHDQITLLRGPPINDQQPSVLLAVQIPSPQFLFQQPFCYFPPGSIPVFSFSPPMPGVAAINHHQLLTSPPQQQQQQQQQLRPTGRHVAREPRAVGNRRESAPPRIKRKRGPGGLTRLCGVSPELQVIVGEAAMPRTQIVKQLWVYIRENNLQDPNNRKKIICNDELRLVLETDSTDIFKMNKLLAKHITPLERTKDAGPESADPKKLKAEDVPAEIEPDDAPCHMIISDALADFLGSEERELLHSEILSRLWDYIKDNQLEDPENTTMILCDPKLEQLFGRDNLVASEISEMLVHHLLKKS